MKLILFNIILLETPNIPYKDRWTLIKTLCGYRWEDVDHPKEFVFENLSQLMKFSHGSRRFDFLG